MVDFTYGHRADRTLRGYIRAHVAAGKTKPPVKVAAPKSFREEYAAQTLKSLEQRAGLLVRLPDPSPRIATVYGRALPPGSTHAYNVVTRQHEFRLGDRAVFLTEEALNEGPYFVQSALQRLTAECDQ